MPNIQRFDGAVIRVATPDGTLFLIVDEDTSGKPVDIRMEIGKAGTAIRAWSEAAGKLLTLAINKGVTLEEVITEISNITSDRLVYHGRVPIRSGPDGLAYGLVRYKGHKYDEMQRVLGGEADRRRRPARIHGGN